MSLDDTEMLWEGSWLLTTMLRGTAYLSSACYSSERVLPSSCRPQVQNASRGVSPRRGWSTSIFLGTRVAEEQPERFGTWFYEHLKGSPGPTLSFPTVCPVLINFLPCPNSFWTILGIWQFVGKKKKDMWMVIQALCQPGTSSLSGKWCKHSIYNMEMQFYSW